MKRQPPKIPLGSKKGYSVVNFVGGVYDGTERVTKTKNLLPEVRISHRNGVDVYLRNGSVYVLKKGA